MSASTAISTSRRARTPGSTWSRSRTRPRRSTTGTSGSPASATRRTSASRLLDGAGRIVNLLNNYAWMSFNFGPTLLQWMAEHAPEVHQGIVEADRLSRRAARRARQRSGPELQSHHHAAGQPAGQGDAGRLGDRRLPPSVRPACRRGCGWRRRRSTSRRSRCWRRRGSASRSWRRGRRGGGGSWGPRSGRRSPGESTRRGPYLCRLPSGRSIVLFFYDAIVSHDVAFRRLLDDGERFLQRIFQGFDDRREHAQLMHIATDGESYGHHHPHGDMALAYVLDRAGAAPGRPADELRRVPRAASAGVGGGDPREQLVELRPWRRALAIGLRLPVPRRLAAEVARPAPPGARRPQGASSTTSSPPAAASASPTPGRRGTPISRSSSPHDRDEAIGTLPGEARPSRPRRRRRSPTPSACWRCSRMRC